MTDETLHGLVTKWRTRARVMENSSELYERAKGYFNAADELEDWINDHDEWPTVYPA